MAEGSVPKVPASGLFDKEYQALEAAYASLLSGAGMLSTAVAAIESDAEDLSDTDVRETVLAALKQLKNANDAFEGHLESPLHKEMEAIRDPLWDVLDLVFVGAHVLDSVLPGQSEKDPEDRPSSDHPEAALLRVAANMAAARGRGSIAAVVAQLQEKIRNQRGESSHA